MNKKTFDKLFGRALFSKNWEAKIEAVKVVSCEKSEDPLCYKAVFCLKDTGETFEIGASLLAQRERNLTRAGYKVPMTQRAITLVERKLGKILPQKIEALARAV